MPRTKGSRNKATLEGLLSPALTINAIAPQETPMTPKPTKTYAKTIHLHQSSELAGGKPTFTATRDGLMEVTPLGVKIKGRKSKRILLVPWPNIKVCELHWIADEE
jgi:hypothetical protein